MRDSSDAPTAVPISIKIASKGASLSTAVEGQEVHAKPQENNTSSKRHHFCTCTRCRRRSTAASEGGCQGCRDAPNPRRPQCPPCHLHCPPHHPRPPLRPRRRLRSHVADCPPTWLQGRAHGKQHLGLHQKGSRNSQKWSSAGDTSSPPQPRGTRIGLMTQSTYDEKLYLGGSPGVTCDRCSII